MFVGAMLAGIFPTQPPLLGFTENGPKIREKKISSEWQSSWLKCFVEVRGDWSDCFQLLGVLQQGSIIFEEDGYGNRGPQRSYLLSDKNNKLLQFTQAETGKRKENCFLV